MNDQKQPTQAEIEKAMKLLEFHNIPLNDPIFEATQKITEIMDKLELKECRTILKNLQDRYTQKRGSYKKSEVKTEEKPSSQQPHKPEFKGKK